MNGLGLFALLVVLFERSVCLFGVCVCVCVCVCVHACVRVHMCVSAMETIAAMRTNFLRTTMRLPLPNMVRSCDFISPCTVKSE